MSKSTTHRTALHTRLRSGLRTRAAAVTVGACASAVLATAGVATTAGSAAGASELTGGNLIAAQATAQTVADATRSQADAQQQAAQAAAKAEQKAKDAEEAERAKAKSWMAPITADYELSAPFGNSGDRWTSSHSGQDFAVPTGTAVRAVHGGTVVKAGGNGAGDGPAYGNAIVIKHDDGVYTQYAHLDRVEVKVGDKVTTGDRIAASGNTGNSTGPHLHFELRTTPDYGSAIDPVTFLRDKDVTL